jgi:hypothetical protein
MVADVLAYIVGLMLYSDQNDKVIALCDEVTDWCGVGISIFHGGWHNLARNLLSKSRNVICCDETAMEACITLEIQEHIYRARHADLPAEYQNLAYWYQTTEQYGFVHDGFGCIYSKVGCNSTGHLLTIHNNNDGSTLKKLYHLAKQVVDVDDLVNLYHDAGVKIVGDDDIIPYHPRWEGLIESSREIGFETKVEHWNVPLSKASFLNFGFVFDIGSMMYTFRPNYDKLFAGLFFYRKDNSWRLTLSRLYAMKVLCYTNRTRYAEVQYYITHILHTHKHHIAAETEFDAVITEKSLYSQDKSSREIEYLLYSLESQVSTLRPEITPLGRSL